MTKKLLIGRTKMLFAHYNVNKQWLLHNHITITVTVTVTSTINLGRCEVLGLFHEQGHPFDRQYNLGLYQAQLSKMLGVQTYSFPLEI